MQSSVESSVLLYKKCVGNKRWETDEGIEKRAASTFAEMCKVYGEDNAIKMVSLHDARPGWRIMKGTLLEEGASMQ